MLSPPRGLWDSPTPWLTFWGAHHDARKALGGRDVPRAIGSRAFPNTKGKKEGGRSGGAPLRAPPAQFRYRPVSDRATWPSLPIVHTRQAQSLRAPESQPPESRPAETLP